MPPIPQFAKVLAKRAKAKPKVTKTVTVAKKATKTKSRKIGIVQKEKIKKVLLRNQNMTSNYIP